MRMPIRLPLLVAVAATAVVACGSVAPSVSPAAPSSLAPQPSPQADTYWLRATASQAIPPIDQFPIPPVATITGDGTYITVGPQDAMYPGPALPNLIGRPVSDVGRARLLAEAQRLGLLSGQTDFTAEGGVPGGVTGRLELTVDGKRVTLTGSPEAEIQCVTTPCEAPPGTPAAFAAFWSSLQDPTWLGDAVGRATPYVADRLCAPGRAAAPGRGVGAAADPRLAAGRADRGVRDRRRERHAAMRLRHGGRRRDAPAGPRPGEPGEPMGPGSVDERDIRGRGAAVRPRRGPLRGVVRACLSRVRDPGA